jgi:ligand-binding SRPBCC domain-containing protein
MGTMVPVIEFELSSTLAAPRPVVWGVVSTMRGVNDELGPWLRMTFPVDRAVLAEGSVVPGRVLFRSWTLLFGFVPLDRHALVLDVIDDGDGFVEESSSWLQRRWRHERMLMDFGDGSCVVTDRLVVEPRLQVTRPLIAVVVKRVFTHRHRQLRRRFGAG